MEISAEDVINKFCVTKSSRGLYDWWFNKKDQQHVVSRVMDHKSEVANKIRVEDVDIVSRIISNNPEEHALGDIKKSEITKVDTVTDWRPDFAFSHLFHFLLEDKGRLFTFNEFAVSDIAKSLIYEEVKSIVNQSLLRDRDVDESLAKQAVRWRLGNAYYAFLKEQYVCASLREVGIFPIQHPLADALFRVDAWADNVIFALYVGNPKFREKTVGRKKKMEQIYICDNCYKPIFVSMLVEMNVQAKFGKLHLPPADCLKGIPHEINSQTKNTCACSR